MEKKASLLVLGNVITMDEHKPYAEAVAVKDDRIIYVGSKEVAKKLCDDNTKVCDFGKNSVYPGFLEAHCHPGGAGYKMVGTAILSQDISLAENVKRMKEYMDKNPDADIITGIGFSTIDEDPNAAMFDAICLDKPMIAISVDGHSAWLNTKAMEKFNINKDAVKQWGTACVRVDDDGNPTGFLSEGPAIALNSQVEKSVDIMKKSLLAWQEYALSNGYTGVYNAGVDLVSTNEPIAYQELEKEGKLRHYTFAGSLVADNTDTPEEDIQRIAKEAKDNNTKHYNVIGAKVFCDGVVEAHTAWMLDDYKDQPGYKGVSRFDDHEKMVRLLKAASENDLNVHIHTIGDAAIKAWIDAIAKAEEETGDFDMRNAMAHLQVMRKEDEKRFADYNIMAVCGILWASREPGYYEQECGYIGEDKAAHSYPTQSLRENGAVVVSHSDYPVSPAFSAPRTMCMGAGRHIPSRGKETIRNADQALSRLDTLKAITTSVAYSWHEEDNMGSLEVGKLANMTVFDKDFMNDDLAEVENSKCLATFVDGNLEFAAQ